jgi:ferritin-like metal-binding protein YciE
VSQSFDIVRDYYIAGLRNAHAMETQAIQLLTRQVERLESYPEMEARMRLHLREPEHQKLRLEEVLGSLNEEHSSLKDAALGLVGNLAALAHSPAPDEVLKNTLANFAFEHGRELRRSEWYYRCPAVAGRGRSDGAVDQ